MLREHGYSAEQVEAMPVLHAVFLYQAYRYDVLYDELRKSVGLPYAQAVATESLSADSPSNRSSSTPRDLASAVVPAVGRVVAASARVDRKIAALRCVEAIRLYAKSHGDKLPGKLADVTEVPIPDDPWTGKPFEYRLDGSTATLIGPAPATEVPGAPNYIRYDLTIRVKKGDE